MAGVKKGRQECITLMLRITSLIPYWIFYDLYSIECQSTDEGYWIKVSVNQSPYGMRYAFYSKGYRGGYLNAYSTHTITFVDESIHKSVCSPSKGSLVPTVLRNTSLGWSGRWPNQGFHLSWDYSIPVNKGCRRQQAPTATALQRFQSADLSCYLFLTSATQTFIFGSVGHTYVIHNKIRY